MKLHVPRAKFEVVSGTHEAQCVAKVATDYPSKKNYVFWFLYIRVRVRVRVVMILTKEQNIIIIALRRK